MHKKVTILYLVSTLTRSGPTNQLYSLIKHLNRDVFDPFLITLSPEPADSRWSDFEDLGVDLFSLDLSRLKGFVFGKQKLNKYIENISPNIIHSQGIRADLFMSKKKDINKWVSTVHNNPFLDYSMRFNSIQARIMIRKHLKAFSNCLNLISCSNAIANQLKKHGLNSKSIQNGVDLSEIDSFSPISMNGFERPIFISVGKLIKRKNMRFLINTFNMYSKNNKGTLMILGDGPESDELKKKAGDKIVFQGSVNNVPAYMHASDFFISSSLAEGLPYAVIEALASELPVILSDIPSHDEVKKEAKFATSLFDLDNGPEHLKKLMIKITDQNKDKMKLTARKAAEDCFSADVMSKKYQKEYKKVVEY